MNAVLPTGIESYLKEAGFSATEMLLLRKLVEEDSLTIRELASKTGKSTGILDQAMKKLMTKKIAQRSIINDQPRYSINSLDAVLRWVKNDMLERKSTLERRHENFESFIATLKVDKKRPDIEHYHGSDGIKQAYLKLLESGQELLTFTPILTRTEEDPYRLFRVELFRKRQVRKIFQRILAPDSTLARRFQSRDPFEYRRTLLVPEQDLPLTFEKTIVGDTIACFNFEEESACFLKYPDLAKAERAHFESLWAKQLTAAHAEPSAVLTPAQIPLKTRLLSSLHEFLLSPRSVIAFIILALISAALTLGFFAYNRELNFQVMREKVATIAATGVLQIRPEDVEQLRVEADWQKPEWARVINTMIKIREKNSDVLFVYIIRKRTDDPSKFEFVADSHSLNPYANVDADLTNDVDVNHNGIYDSQDFLQWPGMPYETAPVEAFEAYDGSIVTTQFYEDQWGKVVTGYAPIKNANGETVAVFAVDIEASILDQRGRETFVPLYLFIILFVCFVFVRALVFGQFLLAHKRTLSR